MAFTLATLLSTVEGYLQTTETSFVANFNTMVLQAEDRIYKSVIMPANRTTATLTLTSGVTTSTLPADFLAPFEFRVINTDNTYSPVIFTDVSMMRELYPDPNYVGVPRWYSLASDTTIIMSPTPTTGLSGSLRYFYKPASLTVNTSGTWLSTNAENLLLYACLVEGYTYLKGEPDLMKTYEEKYQEALAGLRLLGEGSDMGDAYRMGERRIGKTTP